ncbi:MAG: hypothetical protein ACP5M0_08630, partial [Desulfomonilaceae bacterium]
MKRKVAFSGKNDSEGNTRNDRRIDKPQDEAGIARGGLSPAPAGRNTIAQGNALGTRSSKATIA